jgi:hypothetical protein
MLVSNTLAYFSQKVFIAPAWDVQTQEQQFLLSRINFIKLFCELYVHKIKPSLIFVGWSRSQPQEWSLITGSTRVSSTLA